CTKAERGGRSDGYSAAAAGADGAPRGGGDSDVPRLLPECAAMVDRVPVLVLPLVNHLVQQGVQRLVPAMPLDVRVADGDLRTLPPRKRGGVVAEAALHAPGHAYGDRPEQSLEVARVVPPVPLLQLLHQPRVLGPGAGSPARGTGALHRLRQYRLTSRTALRACTS